MFYYSLLLMSNYNTKIYKSTVLLNNMKTSYIPILAMVGSLFSNSAYAKDVRLFANKIKAKALEIDTSRLCKTFIQYVILDNGYPAKIEYADCSFKNEKYSDAMRITVPGKLQVQSVLHPDETTNTVLTKYSGEKTYGKTTKLYEDIKLLGVKEQKEAKDIYDALVVLKEVEKLNKELDIDINELEQQLMIIPEPSPDTLDELLKK